MREPHGVRKGQRVRTFDGEDLGRVTRLYDSGFAVLKGFPILFGKDTVVRYDEVRGERDGALVVARSARDLFELAEGEIPGSWRVPVPHGFPSAATPGEARGVYAAVASWPVAGVRPGDAAATPAQPAGSALEPSEAAQARAAAGAGTGREGEPRGTPTSLIWRREDTDHHAR
jgi:hypothetical protein